jgi:hypothetical protein
MREDASPMAMMVVYGPSSGRMGWIEDSRVGGIGEVAMRLK